jgi:hypothetical protein
MIIYKTTNLINGKYYVGKDQKNNPEYLGSGMLLTKAIKKYGKENFKKEILEECFNKEELATRERYWIEKLDARNKKIAYNIGEGGDGGDNFSGHPDLDKIKKKISDSVLGRESWNKGKTGVYSEESLERMKNARLVLTGESSSNFVKIDKDVLNELLLTNTINETARKLNISVSCVRRKIKDFSLDYSVVKNIRKEKKIKVGKTPNYYEISDELFNKILAVRNKDKKTIEELAEEFNIGVNKLRHELRKRTGSERIKRIRQ